MTDTVSRYRGSPASAVLALGGLALIAGVAVLVAMVVDRWRDDSGAAAAAFWILVAVGVVLLAGIVRAVVQVVHPSVVLRLDSTGYRVSRQSGASGVRSAVWSDVERVRRDHRGGREYVIVALRTGAATEIPVRSIATPRQEWLAELDDRLNRAHGQRRL